MSARDLLAAAGIVIFSGLLVALCGVPAPPLPGPTEAELELWLQRPYATFPESGETLGFVYQLSEQVGVGDGFMMESAGAGLPPESLRPVTPSETLAFTGLVLGLFDETAGQAYYVAPLGWPTRLLGEHRRGSTEIQAEARSLDRGVVAARFPFVAFARVALFEVAGGHVVHVRFSEPLADEPPGSHGPASRTIVGT